MGRVKTYESIVKGENVPVAGIPESFKVLVKEIRSLALDIEPLRDEEPKPAAAPVAEDDIDLANDDADTSLDALDAQIDELAAPATDKE